MRPITLISAAALGLGALFQPVAPVQADSAFETYGDIMQIAIPLTAAAISVGKEDYNGTLQLTAGALVTFGVVMGLKVAVDTERPNGKS